MIILNALYKKPSDSDAFHTYYEEVHMPLALTIPGLVKAEAEMVSATFSGNKGDHYMLARLYFADEDSFNAAMQSEQNKATGKDLRNFADGGVDLFITRT